MIQLIKDVFAAGILVLIFITLAAIAGLDNCTCNKGPVIRKTLKQTISDVIKDYNKEQSEVNKESR